MAVLQLSPRRFLTLTTHRQRLARIWTTVHHDPRPAVSDVLLLGICLETGRVVYHDGRHRALRAWIAGQRSIPVNVRFHSEKAAQDNSFATYEQRLHNPAFDSYQIVWGEVLPPPQKLFITGQYRRGLWIFHRSTLYE